MSSRENPACKVLSRLRTALNSKPFVPFRWLRQGDLQTLGAFFWPGRSGSRDLTGDEERLFAVAENGSVLGRCRWQPNRPVRPRLLMWHGIEGSAAAAY